jgi:hypothetical protein
MATSNTAMCRSDMAATTIEHLDDNLLAAELQLAPADLSEIDDAYSKIDIRGAPLPEALESRIDR